MASGNGQGTEEEQTKLERYLYTGKNVMVVVPHEDDDLNLMAGQLEQYVAAGSTVRVVFVTNGDAKGLGETRIAEALQVLGSYGIPEENVIFLAYGDQWNDDHIYYGDPDEVMVSCAGRTETYGSAQKQPFAEHTYTREHLLEDLEQVILKYRPDTLFCNDFDTHCDHRAVSLFFEEAMGRVLKETVDYQPDVYKGFAYFQAWRGEEDFGSAVLPSAHDEDGGNILYNPVYLWEDRVRFPVDPEGLSEKLEECRTYQALAGYASQNAVEHAARIIKSDKIFWKRRTDNPVLKAQVTVSSGDAEALHDFKISDSWQILEQEPVFDKGIWRPKDPHKTAEVCFAEEQTISEIDLYEDSSEENHIFNAEITFSDGSVINTGPLHNKGDRTAIKFEERSVSYFKIRIVDWQGEPGLTEIEAFHGEDSVPEGLLKVTDASGNFLYDTATDASGKMALRLYGYRDGMQPIQGSLCPKDYEISLQGKGCWMKMNDEEIQVKCNAGRTAIVTVRDKQTGELLDRIRITNLAGEEQKEKCP